MVAINSVRTISCIFLHCLLISHAMSAPLRSCPMPTKKSLSESAVIKNSVFPGDVDTSELRVLADTQSGRRGHWLQLTNETPVIGLIMWLPCGAKSGPLLKTGGFVNWHKNILLPNQLHALSLTSVGFGSGFEAHEVAWLVIRRNAIQVVLDRRTYERASGKNEIINQGMLRPAKKPGVWHWLKTKHVNGKMVEQEHQVLCYKMNAKDLLISIDTCDDALSAATTKKQRP